MKLLRLINCPGCNRPARPVAGLYRCENCRTEYNNRWPDSRPLTPREREHQADPGRTPPIDGRPVPIDRRLR